MRTSLSQHPPYPTKVLIEFSATITTISYDVLVVYRDRTVTVSNPTEFPEVSDVAAHVKEVQEPVVKASIIVPQGGYLPS